MKVVPLDSTAISLQQSKSRKGSGKLIRKRRNRLKGNRSSYTNLAKAKVQTFIPHQPITRSKSFTRSRSQRRSPINSERTSPRVSPISVTDRNAILSPGPIPPENVGRTSPRQKTRRSTKPGLKTFNNLLSLKDKGYSRKDSRRKSTGGSNPVHAIVSGGTAKPLSPITRSGQQMPLSPLARTPSPGPERYQQSNGGPPRCQSWAPLSGSGRSSPSHHHKPVMRRRASLASCPEGAAYIERAFYECEVVARNREADSADEKTLGSVESKNH
jgi:hypothetical protein